MLVKSWNFRGVPKDPASAADGKRVLASLLARFPVLRRVAHRRAMGQPVVQFEIAGRNGGKLREFYGYLFDWKIEKSDPAGTSPVKTGGRSGIDGSIREEANGPVEITVYVQV